MRDEDFPLRPVSRPARGQRLVARAVSFHAPGREARIRRALDQIQDPNVTIYVTNTAPYLADYQPYGEGAKFRVANLWPMSPARNVVRTINSLRTASYMQVQAWKKGGPRWSK